MARDILWQQWLRVFQTFRQRLCVQTQVVVNISPGASETGEKWASVPTTPEVIVLQHLACGYARVGVEYQQLVKQIDRVLVSLIS